MHDFTEFLNVNPWALMFVLSICIFTLAMLIGLIWTWDNPKPGNVTVIEYRETTRPSALHVPEFRQDITSRDDEQPRYRLAKSGEIELRITTGRYRPMTRAVGEVHEQPAINPAHPRCTLDQSRFMVSDELRLLTKYDSNTIDKS